MNFACKGPAGRVGSPHNLAFQILSEWGIPASHHSVVARFFSALAPDQRPEISSSTTVIALNTLRALLITAVLAALVHLMVSNLLNSPASQIAGALIIGWLLGVMPGRTTHTKAHSAVALLTVVSLCSLLLLPFAYHETRQDAFIPAATTRWRRRSATVLAARKGLQHPGAVSLQNCSEAPDAGAHQPHK